MELPKAFPISDTETQDFTPDDISSPVPETPYQSPEPKKLAIGPQFQPDLMERLRSVTQQAIKPPPMPATPNFGKQQVEPQTLNDIMGGMFLKEEINKKARAKKAEEESKRMIQALLLSFAGGALAGVIAYGVFRSRYSNNKDHD